jgi:hypothetical protein
MVCEGAEEGRGVKENDFTDYDITEEMFTRE